MILGQKFALKLLSSFVFKPNQRNWEWIFEEDKTAFGESLFYFPSEACSSILIARKAPPSPLFLYSSIFQKISQRFFYPQLTGRTKTTARF